MSERIPKIIEEVRARAKALGFDVFGIADPYSRPDLEERLNYALERGWHADMVWMEEHKERRAHPSVLWKEVKSIVMLGMNYGPEGNPMDRLAQPDLANISAYAQTKDYHDVLKGKLKEVAGLLGRRMGADVKVFVDTAPVMEKPFAQQAGLGWQGKHSVLVSPEFGSWLFLGVIYTTAEMPFDTPHRDQCGRCTRCVDICPTQAIVAPYQLDASRCLAYYSVEHKGAIPLEFRVPMGNRIFGCDDCLAICPWNKFAKRVAEDKLKARDAISQLSLSDALDFDEAGFRDFFASTPVKRLGLERFMRNALIVVGNSGNREYLPRVRQAVEHESVLVRAMAVWAAKRLMTADEFLEFRAVYFDKESDETVKVEWEVVL